MSDYIEVQTPDGMVRFPKGMSRADMAAALNKRSMASLPPNMAAAKAAREGTLTVPPEAARRAEEFNKEHGGDLYDATHMGRAEALGRGALQGLTFGFGDEAVAGVRSVIQPGETYDSALANERQALEIARRDRPGYAMGGELAGAVASPVNALIPGGATSGGLGTRVVTSGAAGAGAGAAYGFGTGEGGVVDRAQNAALMGGIGGAVGVAVPAIGAAVQKGADGLAVKRRIADLVRGAPSTEALRAEGRAAYQAIDDAGVMVKPEAAQRGLGGIRDSLISEGVGLDTTGKVFPGARAIADATEQIGADGAPVPFGQLDVLRRFMGNTAGANPVNKADTRLATQAVAGVDDMVNKLTPDDISAGDIEALQTMLPKARDIWARMSRSQTIDDAINAGDNYLSGPASGIRNQFSRILKNPKLSRGFSEAEKAVMRRVAQGSLPEQLLHLAGGGMANLLSIVGAGAGAGIPGAALAGAGAAGLRKASEAVTRRNAEIARAVIASGGLPNSVSGSPAARNLVEALLMKSLRSTVPTSAQQALRPSVPQ